MCSLAQVLFQLTEVFTQVLLQALFETDLRQKKKKSIALTFVCFMTADTLTVFPYALFLMNSITNDTMLSFKSSKAKSRQQATICENNLIFCEVCVNTKHPKHHQFAFRIQTTAFTANERVGTDFIMWPHTHCCDSLGFTTFTLVST